LLVSSLCEFAALAGAELKSVFAALGVFAVFAVFAGVELEWGLAR